MNYFSSMQPLWKVPKGQSVKNHYRIKKKTFASWQENYDKPRQCVEKQRQYSANKGPYYSQGCGLPSGHVQLWELDSKEGRGPRNWCLWTVVLRSLLRVPWTARRATQSIFREINWILVESTVAEVETPIFWSSDVNSWLIGKVPDAGKDWGQKEKRASEDEIAVWHLWCNGHELGQTSGDGEGQRGLMCCSPWCHRVGHDWVVEQQKSSSQCIKGKGK